MKWFNWRRRQKKPVGQVATIDNRQLAIVDLGTAISRDVRALIDRNTLTHGEPFRSGPAVFWVPYASQFWVLDPPLLPRCSPATSSWRQRIPRH